MGDHVFQALTGFVKLKAKLHTVKQTSESQGDAGGQSLKHKVSLTVVGDHPVYLDSFENMLNEEFIILLKDADCDGTFRYTQLGCDCNGSVVSSLVFDSNTTKEGVKEYALEFEVPYCKYFYSGLITYHP